MGKRSDFPRVERNFYPTPAAAVVPLVPHLPAGEVTYWEPCAGDGALIRALDDASDATCVYASDIHEIALGWPDPVNALETQAPDCADFIITNPPWDRKTLHPMIEHFSDQRPTGLLFDADWVHTKQSIPYMPRLRKIVPIGRLKWIPDSKYTGKDNCAWHLFDKPSDEPAEFYGRIAA